MANVIDYILRIQDEASPTLNKFFKKFKIQPERMLFKVFDELKDAVKEAANFEKQMVEITKVLDTSFVSNVNNVQKLKNELRGVGRAVPKNIDEIMGIASEGSKMGIKGDKIAEFTRGIADISVAFEVSAEEAANKFVKVLTSFGKEVSYQSIQYLGGEMNEIANNMKVKGGELLTALNLSTAALSAAGMNEKQIIALNAAGIQVGLQPGVTGNAMIKYASMLNKIQETRKGRWALHYLGFNEKSWNQMRVDPIKRNEEILTRLSQLRTKGIKGDIKSQTQYQKTLDAFFGFYRGKDMDRVIAQLGEYYKAMNLVTDETSVQTSLQTEVAQVSDTLAARTIVLKNSFREFIGEIGDTFIPTLKKITEALSGTLNTWTDWLKQSKTEKRFGKDAWNLTKSAAVTAGTYLAYGALISAAGLTSPIWGPALAAVGATAAVGAGAWNYVDNQKKYAPQLYSSGKDLDSTIVRRLNSPSRENLDSTIMRRLNNPLVDLNETTNQMALIKQGRDSISVNVTGDLKTPKGYEIENLNFAPLNGSNKNFSLAR